MFLALATTSCSLPWTSLLPQLECYSNLLDTPICTLRGTNGHNVWSLVINVNLETMPNNPQNIGYFLFPRVWLPKSP